MEKVNFDYSTKSSPVPNSYATQQSLISKMGKTVHNMRWKATFFLKPHKKPTPKEYFGFKSMEPAPPVPLLKPFEDGFAELIKNDFIIYHRS